LESSNKVNRNGYFGGRLVEVVRVPAYTASARFMRKGTFRFMIPLGVVWAS